MCLDQCKTITDIIQSIITTLAIIVGGVWAVYHFFVKRERFPKAKTSHSIECYPIDSSKKLLRVAVTIENNSSVLLKLASIDIRVLQIKPYPEDFLTKVKSDVNPIEENKSNYTWPYLFDKSVKYNKTEIEPNENETFIFDFIAESSVEVIGIYSYVKNTEKKEIGWTLNTNHKL